MKINKKYIAFISDIKISTGNWENKTREASVIIHLSNGKEITIKKIYCGEHYFNIDIVTELETKREHREYYEGMFVGEWS